jgi:hypothetical protein
MVPSSEQEFRMSRINRRQVLRAGALGAGTLALGPLLAACAPSDEELVGEEPGGPRGRLTPRARPR